MNISIKLFLILILSNKAYGSILISHTNTSNESYTEELLSSKVDTSFIDYYLESPISEKQDEELRRAFSNSNNLYLSGERSAAIHELKRVMALRHKADWPPVYRKMISISAKQISTIDKDNYRKWTHVNRIYSETIDEALYSKTYLKLKYKNTKILINGVLQGSHYLLVPKGDSFRLTVISNKYIPYSLVTNYTSLKNHSFKLIPFLDNNCLINDPYKHIDFKVAYETKCVKDPASNILKLLSDNSTEVTADKKNMFSEINKPTNKPSFLKKNKWLIIASTAAISILAYSYKKNNESQSRRGF